MPLWARWAPPIAVQVAGRKVWTCCGSCAPKLKAQAGAGTWLRFSPPPRDQVLSVPEAAVIDTGTRKVVYVEVEPGVFEGRGSFSARIGDRFPCSRGSRRRTGRGGGRVPDRCREPLTRRRPDGRARSPAAVVRRLGTAPTGIEPMATAR